MLDLQHDVFYLVYFAVTLALVASYARVEQVDVAAIFLRPLAVEPRGRSSSPSSLSSTSSTLKRRRHDHGAYFVFELLWRGVGYGLIDTLLLTAFPCFIAYRLLNGHVGGLMGKLRFTALTLPLVISSRRPPLGLPAVPRGRLSRPETGNVLISIPSSQPPIRRLVRRAVSQHVAAVTPTNRGSSCHR